MSEADRLIRQTKSFVKSCVKTYLWGTVIAWCILMTGTYYDTAQRAFDFADFEVGVAITHAFLAFTMWWAIIPVAIVSFLS